ncbi:hypothetical protein F66182_1946 [Fusarium sp. NRRL 66182]|nr:hypothetical protein F66182_1946 [Fusarium sp. NRRL 66182]
MGRKTSIISLIVFTTNRHTNTSPLYAIATAAHQQQLKIVTSIISPSSVLQLKLAHRFRTAFRPSLLPPLNTSPYRHTHPNWLWPPSRTGRRGETATGVYFQRTKAAERRFKPVAFLEELLSQTAH